jgi:hypothetical protein
MQVPVVVKFLEYVQIEFRVFDDESTSDLHMYPPLISVRYRDVQLPLPVGEDTRRVTVHVAWSRDSEALRSTWSTAKLLFGFSVFFWIAYATAKMINEDRRLPYHSTEISKFFRIILYVLFDGVNPETVTLYFSPCLTHSLSLSLSLSHTHTHKVLVHNDDTMRYAHTLCIYVVLFVLL